MRTFFDVDGPIINGLTKASDVFILNMLVLLCSLPIFTFGASYTALYYVTLKMVKDEDCYIVKSFFRSFKQNFKQATVIWLIMIVIGTVIYCDFKIMGGDFLGVNPFSDSMVRIISILMMSASLIYMFTLVYVFPVLSRFDNSIKNTIKNALIMSIRHFPFTLAIIAITFLPLIFMYIVPRALILLIIVFGLSAYINSYMFVKIFSKYMPKENIAKDEEFEVHVEE